MIKEGVLIGIFRRLGYTLIDTGHTLDTTILELEGGMFSEFKREHIEDAFLAKDIKLVELTLNVEHNRGVTVSGTLWTSSIPFTTDAVLTIEILNTDIESLEQEPKDESWELKGSL